MGSIPITRSTSSAYAEYLKTPATFLRQALVAAALGICGTVGAQTYDDFSGDGIDAAKWTRSGDSAHFTQSGGRLHFPCRNGASESLVATRTFPAGFFRLEFSDFDSTNHSPAGQGLGSYVLIALEAGDEHVRMLRGNVAPTGYFEGNHIKNGRPVLWYDRYDVDHGQLGLYFDGSRVSFFYNTGVDPAKGWRQVGPSVAPEWKSMPRMYIRGHSGGSGCTRFSVAKVEFTPAPLPTALLQALQ